jgi:hypothetical protein
MAKESFSDQLWKGLGDAITDIRQKVVEEAYFGRAVTQLDVPQWPQCREQEPDHVMGKEQEHERGQEIDIDR